MPTISPLLKGQYITMETYFALKVVVSVSKSSMHL